MTTAQSWDRRGNRNLRHDFGQRLGVHLDHSDKRLRAFAASSDPAQFPRLGDRGLKRSAVKVSDVRQCGPVHPALRHYQNPKVGMFFIRDGKVCPRDTDAGALSLNVEIVHTACAALVARSFGGRRDEGDQVKLPVFLASAWTAANDKARELGWIK